MRLANFIWAVRFFKSKTKANQKCNASKLKLNDSIVKPSKQVNIGQTILIKESPIWRTYEVIGIPKSRVGAKLVNQYIKETTSQKDLTLLAEFQLAQKLSHNQSLGARPTKRNRRKLDEMN